jgi:hypothetical protein
MTKQLTDRKRAKRYAMRIYGFNSQYIAELAYLAGLRMGRKLEREKKSG